MALSPTDGETFMREVDDAVRADFFERFFRNYGKLTLAIILVALLGLGGWLYWRHHEQTVADANGRMYSAVIDALADPAVRSKVESMGFEVLPGSPAQLLELIRAETELAHRLIRLGRLSSE